MMRIAINGFGRIGRMVFRAIIESGLRNLQIIAINDIGNVNSLLHLLKYDSVHGKLIHNIMIEGQKFKIDNNEWIEFISEKDPNNLPWQKLDIDLVIDCSGQMKNHKLLTKHIDNGAKKVIVSTIIDDADFTVIYGINHQKINKSHKILSNASCTSNCLITALHPIYESVGIKYGNMTSIHAYTSDQNIVDSAHQDLRRSRAVSASIIPSSTNASKAIEILYPELKNKIHCTAARVPILNVSMIDFNFVSKNKTSVEEINDKIIKASQSYLRGIIDYSDVPLVSVDFVHNPASVIIDITQTSVTEKVLCKLVGWYDNEWGYASRICDVANYIHKNHLCN